MADERAIFGLERVWRVADQLWPPFVNQLVVEGEGRLSADALRAAVAAVLPAWPAARARHRGWLRGSRWSADGAPPRVTHAAGWDGFTAHPALDTPLDAAAGPLVELLTFGERVVLRTHHAAFDGRAAWALAEDVGAALRGEPVRGARFAGVTEPPGGAAAPEPPPDSPLPPVVAAGAPGRVWARRSLAGVATAGLLPRTLVALAEGFPAPIRVSVPVDLRPRLPEAERRVAANLAGFVRVEVRAGEAAEAVAARLGAAVAGEAALGALRAADGLRVLPLWVMRAAGGAAAARALREGRAPVTATVSNLGRADAGVFDAPGFVGRRCFWIPPANPGSPVFVTLTGHAAGVELVVAMPAALGAGGAVEALAEAVAAALERPVAWPPGSAGSLAAAAAGQ